MTEKIEQLEREIASLKSQISALKTGFNLLLARSDLQEGAVQTLVELHPEKKKFAERAREIAAELLDARAAHPNAQYEEYLTLALAAMLEAAGEPPPHDSE